MREPSKNTYAANEDEMMDMLDFKEMRDLFISGVDSDRYCV